MISIVWEFVVKEDAVPAFQRAYGPTGEWVALFRQHAGFEGTTLLQDSAARGRFLTIDRWQSEAHFDQMKRESHREYARLDALFEGMTLSERKVGVFLG